MREILDVIHKTIYQFFDVCGDDEETPISDKDKLLLEVNKAICNNIKALEQEPCGDAISRQAVLDIDFKRIILTTAKPSEMIEQKVKALPPVKPQEPKQVELEGDGYAYGTNEIVYDFGKCPICGWEFEEGDKDWEEPYCCHCGQKLTWFDSTEANE